MLREAQADMTAFAAFPVDHWRRVWSTNPLERLIKESSVARTSSASSPTSGRSNA
jgi:transposase-like protein